MVCFYSPGVSWFIPAEELRAEGRKENCQEDIWRPSTSWFEPCSRTKPWREPLRQRQGPEEENKPTSWRRHDPQPRLKPASSAPAALSLQVGLVLMGITQQILQKTEAGGPQRDVKPVESCRRLWQPVAQISSLSPGSGCSVWLCRWRRGSCRRSSAGGDRNTSAGLEERRGSCNLQVGHTCGHQKAAGLLTWMYDSRHQEEGCSKNGDDPEI